MMRKFLFLLSASSISKVIAILREMLFASLWGITAAADAFRAAITVTLAPIHVVTADALTSTFVPQYRAEKERGEEAAAALFASVALALLSFAFIASALLFAVAPLLTRLLVPGFEGERLLLATRMVRILAIGLPFYVWTSLLISLEVGEREFRLPALRPLAQNGGVAIAIVLGYLSGRPVWIAWGFTATYALFAAAGTFWLLRKGHMRLWPLPGWGSFRERMAPFLRLLRPMLFLALLTQANAVIEKSLASLVGPGVVASLDYARFIPDAILMLLVLPLGLISLASLANGSAEETGRRADRLASSVVVAFLPLSGFVFAASGDIVGILYRRGTFTSEAALLTTRALMGMAAGLWAASLAYVLQKTLNALRRNHDVLAAGGAGVAVNLVFNLCMYKTLGILALGIGFSLGGILTTVVCLRRLGGMEETRRMLRDCLSAAVPYAAIGALMDRYAGRTPVAGLAVQLAWGVLFWGVFFLRAEGPRKRVGELRRLVAASFERSRGGRGEAG